MPKHDEQTRAFLAFLEANPKEAQALLYKVDARNIRPHEHQRLIMESTARFRVINAGRRFGKTLISAKIFISKAEKPGQMLWWVAPTYKVVKRGYAEVLKQLDHSLLAKPAPPESNFDAGRTVILHFKNGTKMEFYSAERPEGMLGAGVNFAVLDEAAIMPSKIWNQIVSPTLMDYLGEALMISTPRGRNWFYDVWRKGQSTDEENADYESWSFTTMDNPTLPPGEAVRMANSMPRMEADQEIYGKWLAAGSSVFLLSENAIENLPIYRDGLVEGRRKIEGPVFLGVDLARTNDYTVLYGTTELDRRNVYFERMQAISWAEQRRRIKRAVRTLMAAGAEYVQLMVDEGNAGSVIVEDLEEAGLSVVGVNFTTHKANMVRLLANDLERGRAFILDEQIEEFENYLMAMTPAGKITYSAPEGQHDDVVSGKMLSHWGCVNEGSGNIQMIDTSNPSNTSTEEELDPWDDDEGEDYSDLYDEDEVYLPISRLVVPRMSGATRELTPEQVLAAHGMQPHEVDVLLG